MFLDFNAGNDVGIVQAAVADQLSFYDRGVLCSRNSDDMDLIEAHKWFNLAAMMGDDRGAHARADIAHDMVAREIAEAQRRARAFLRAM